VTAWTLPVAAALLGWAGRGLGRARCSSRRRHPGRDPDRRGSSTTRRRAAARRTAAVDLVTAVAAELRGGAEPRAALAAACGPAFTAVAAAARKPRDRPGRCAADGRRRQRVRAARGPRRGLAGHRRGRCGSGRACRQAGRDRPSCRRRTT
jgi:hypothetical protein